jgi:micrococcal nuclease
MYEYAATVVDVHDGDTITVNVDLGFDQSFNKMHLRLLGLNAPELSTPAGKLSQTYLAALLSTAGNVLTIRTVKDKQEKYGRYLATLILPDGTDVNQRLIDAGYAKPWDGTGARPV